MIADIQADLRFHLQGESQTRIGTPRRTHCPECRLKPSGAVLFHRALDEGLRLFACRVLGRSVADLRVLAAEQGRPLAAANGREPTE